MFQISTVPMILGLIIGFLLVSYIRLYRKASILHDIARDRGEIIDRCKNVVYLMAQIVSYAEKQNNDLINLTEQNAADVFDTTAALKNYDMGERLPEPPSLIKDPESIASIKILSPEE